MAAGWSGACCWRSPSAAFKIQNLKAQILLEQPADFFGLEAIERVNSGTLGHDSWG